MESIIARNTAEFGTWRDSSRWVSVRQATAADDGLNDNNWAKFLATSNSVLALALSAGTLQLHVLPIRWRINATI